MLTAAVLYLPHSYSPLSYGEQLQLFYEQYYMITTCKHMIFNIYSPSFYIGNSKGDTITAMGGGRRGGRERNSTFFAFPYRTNGTNFGLPHTELLASFPLHKLTLAGAPVV